MSPEIQTDTYIICGGPVLIICKLNLLIENKSILLFLQGKESASTVEEQGETLIACVVINYEQPVNFILKKYIRVGIRKADQMYPL